MDKQQNIVLVTGASGFLGSHLVKYLSQKGESIRAIYNSTEPSGELTQLQNITWQRCDLLDVYDVEACMEGVQEVYHCAAIVSFKESDKEHLLHFNVESTANIVNEAIAHKVRKIVFVSSIAALGRSVDDRLITEEQPWEESKYNSAYAQSKYLSELEIWRGIGEGVQGVAINPGIILGEGNWEQGSARLFHTVYKEFPYYTQGMNAWVDVKDVARALYTLMKGNVSGERFVLSVNNSSYKDVFTIMAHAMNRKPPYRRAGKLLSSIVWRLSELKSAVTGKESTITRQTATTAQRISKYDNSKFQQHFPEFEYTPLEETISRVGKAFLADKEKS